MKKTGIFLLAVILLPVFAVEEKKTVSADREMTLEITNFISILNLIREQHVNSEKIPLKVLFQGAARGMLQAADRFSNYETSAEFKRTVESSKGSFAGIGIVLTNRGGHFMIVYVLPDSPASKAGLKTGDRILAIGKADMKGKSLNDSIALLRGAAGSSVDLKIYRYSSDAELKISVKRAVIKVSSLKNEGILKAKTGYFRITQFTQNTAGEIDAFLEKYKDLDGLIIDLRNNPGGLLGAAVDVCSRFIEKGKLIVSVEDRNKSEKKYTAVSCRKELKLPIAVLVNRNSASAAEIFAGCLKDHKRAVIIGEKTFGKGSVQKIFPLKNGDAVRLTIALYFSPGRKQIHGHGVDPDIPVASSLKQISLTAAHLNQRGTKIPLMETDHYRDEMLSRAVEVLKGINIYRKQ